MRLLVFVVCLVRGCLATQDAQKFRIRFFNDSAEAADLYVDEQFGCSLPVMLKIGQPVAARREFVFSPHSGVY